jgi:2-oxoglutarate dehydrogenase E1 component
MAQWLHEDLCDLGETRPWRVVARKAAASPATGSSKKHAAEQAELMERAFGR